MDGLSYNTGCGTNRSFQYVNPSDVAPYVTMAKQYGWANFMFQTNQGPSAPAHQFIFGERPHPVLATMVQPDSSPRTLTASDAWLHWIRSTR